MLAKLRPIYNQYVLPIGKISAGAGFSADFWTSLGLALSIIAGILFVKQAYWLGLIFAVLMFVSDSLDGATARASGKTSPFGTVFDHVVDRYAEMFIVGGLLVGGTISPLLGVFCLSGIIMASYVRAKAESAGGLQDCTVGIAGRAEKLVIIYIAIALWALHVDNRLPISLFWFVGLISHITAIQRLVYTRSQLIDTQSK